MNNVKYRDVVVDGFTYFVPTNVYWKESRRCWQVSVRLNKKNVVDNFHPAQFEDSVAKAFNAAVKFAKVKRLYPSKEHHRGGLRLSKRSLDGRPCLPLGIGLRKVKSHDGPTAAWIWRFDVYKDYKIIYTTRVGRVDGYTDEQYEAALRRATTALIKGGAQARQEERHQENLRQDHMEHSQKFNPFVQTVYLIGRYHRSKRWTGEDSNLGDSP